MAWSLFAPAKTNLFLDVLERRPDGYHEIGTVFHTLDCGDLLEIHSAPKGQLSLEANAAITARPEDDLIWRAARLTLDRLGVQEGFHFKVDKRMPMGAGLGGGSSDAAAAVRLIHAALGLEFHVDDWIQPLSKLGADVPFFLRGGCALAEGIGEKLLWLESPSFLKDLTVVVATPLDFVPTGMAYQNLKPSGYERWNASREAWVMGSADVLFYNKFEEWVLSQFASIAALKAEMLAYGARVSFLSGSGASVCGLFENEVHAQQWMAETQVQQRFSKKMKFLLKNPLPIEIP
jgi:4-diphosphocytidyl-2-C-methyl-D-erythritol kinase